MKSEFTPGSATVRQFFAFIDERHRIFLKRGEPPPWTDDPILREYKFTNVFRELDRGTVWLRKENTVPDLRCRVFNTFMYRMINYWPTFEEVGLVGPMHLWPLVQAKLKLRHACGAKVFTSAHMTVGRAMEDKIDTTCETLDKVWGMINPSEQFLSMEELFTAIKNAEFYGIGPFINYEIVCDLRFEPGIWNLVTPTDVLTWANLGPGAKRGLRRLGLPETLASMVELYELAGKHTEEHVMVHHRGLNPKANYPYFELREIEHSLCEFDKYCRGGGKEKYRGQLHGTVQSSC